MKAQKGVHLTRTNLVATLGEGDTPLVESSSFGEGRGRLLFKLESCNPTGSYKDRFIAAEVTQLLRKGIRACVATSSGNTGSSLAAYCARYDIECTILVNQDAPAGKLAQMQAHGARVLRIPRFVSDPAVTSAVYRTLSTFSRNHAIALVVSAYRYCPEGMQGVERISQELIGSAAVDHVFVPVGGGGLYSAVAEGFRQIGSHLPRIHAVQPEGCSTVVASFLRGDNVILDVSSTTRISGLAVPSDIDASRALQHLRRCGGRGIAVCEEEVFTAQRHLLEEEGIYSEPAGAASLAGWLRARQEGWVQEDETCVCLVTGNGFKDLSSIEAAVARHPAWNIEAENIPESLEMFLARSQS